MDAAFPKHTFAMDSPIVPAVKMKLIARKPFALETSSDAAVTVFVWIESSIVMVRDAI